MRIMMRIMNERDRSFAANTSSNRIVHLTMEFAQRPLLIDIISSNEKNVYEEKRKCSTYLYLSSRIINSMINSLSYVLPYVDE